MKLTTITDLHENNYILDIFYFLPAKTIIRCSCVCKDWANLIHQPCFPQVYLSRAKAPLQPVLQRDNQIFLAQLDESLYTDSFPADFSIPEIAISVINIPQIFDIPSSVTLKFSICHATYWILAHTTHQLSSNDPQLYKPYQSSYYMYNSITGQHMVVQKAIMDDTACDTGALILARKSKELKLLGSYRKEYLEPEVIYIQTIGTNTWRRIGELHNGSINGQPILVNGLYHWLNDRNELIYSFDTEEETFQVIQTPACLKKYYLGSLQGCLCLTLGCIKGCFRYRGCEIWVMNKYGDQDSWTRKFVIPELEDLEPRACLKNGEILMLYSNYLYDREQYSPMICYDPCSKEFRWVKFRKGLEKEKINWRIGEVSC